jgi:hypothetical protein
LDTKVIDARSWINILVVIISIIIVMSNHFN